MISCNITDLSRMAMNLRSKQLMRLLHQHLQSVFTGSEMLQVFIAGKELIGCLFTGIEIGLTDMTWRKGLASLVPGPAAIASNTPINLCTADWSVESRNADDAHESMSIAELLVIVAGERSWGSGGTVGGTV